jgi:hypothetical protein
LSKPGIDDAVGGRGIVERLAAHMQQLRHCSAQPRLEQQRNSATVRNTRQPNATHS